MLRCNIHSNQLPRCSGCYVVTSTWAWGESSAGSSTRWIAWSAERWWPRWSQQRWEDEEWSWSTRIWWWGACQVDRPEWWADRWWRRASQCGWPCELSCSTTRCHRGRSSPRMDVLSNLGQLDKLWMMSHWCQCPVHLCKRNPGLQCLVLQVMFSWMILSDTTLWLCWEPKRSSSISSKWSFKWGSFEEAAYRRSKETAHQQTENGIWREIERREDCLHRIFHNGWLYTADLNTEDAMDDNDDWAGEDAVILSGIPDELWSDAPTDQLAPEPPDKWIDDLADRVEIQRLCSMQVLVPRDDSHGEITGSLATKMVRKRWMRRSRLVAREFATTRRLDTFSPATGAHTRQTFYNSNTLERKV